MKAKIKLGYQQVDKNKHRVVVNLGVVSVEKEVHLFVKIFTTVLN